MKRNSFCVCLSLLLLLFTACSSEPEPAPAAPPDVAATPAPASTDPLTGMWAGDWGPSADHRNAVTLELKWDGTTLTGTVNPGPNAVQIGKASFDSATNAVMMEADAVGHGGAAVHFVIDGKVEGSMMSGNWTHDNKKGDFKLTKS